MCGSASDRTRAISCGEMFIAKFSRQPAAVPRAAIVAGTFTEPGLISKAQNGISDLTCAALLDEPRHGGAQLWNAAAAARGSYEHLRMRRGVLVERRLRRADACREIRVSRRLRFGEDDLVVDRRLVQVLEHLCVRRLEAVARVDQQIHAREIGAAQKKGIDERCPGLNLSFRSSRIAISRHVDE